MLLKLILAIKNGQGGYLKAERKYTQKELNEFYSYHQQGKEKERLREVVLKKRNKFYLLWMNNNC